MHALIKCSFLCEIYVLVFVIGTLKMHNTVSCLRSYSTVPLSLNVAHCGDMRHFRQRYQGVNC